MAHCWERVYISFFYIPNFCQCLWEICIILISIILSISTLLLRVHFKWLVQLHTYIASLNAFVLDHQGFIKASIEAQKNDCSQRQHGLMALLGKNQSTAAGGMNHLNLGKAVDLMCFSIFLIPYVFFNLFDTVKFSTFNK